MKTIKLLIPDGKKAEWVNGVLKLIDDTPKDITERVKTYEDACKELGIKPIDDDGLMMDGITKDEVAYMKLKTIVKALNEGWQPDWGNWDENKYYSWMMYDDNCSKFKWSSLVECYSYEYSGTTLSPHLCFKTSTLAAYAAKQFEELYNDFLSIK